MKRIEVIQVVIRKTGATTADVLRTPMTLLLDHVGAYARAELPVPNVPAVAGAEAKEAKEGVCVYVDGTPMLIEMTKKELEQKIVEEYSKMLSDLHSAVVTGKGQLTDKDT